jgi:hypothetical protein
MRKLYTGTKKELLNNVENFIKELDLTPEILGLKTENDRIIYYYNYINENNIFKSLIEFPSVYFIRLANFLCKDEERLKEYLNKFHDREDSRNSIMEYRRYLLKSRDNAYEFLKKLTQQIKTKQWNDLYETLQELFLEPFDDALMPNITEMVENGLTAEDIYNWYKIEKNIISITTFFTEYIRQRVS